MTVVDNQKLYGATHKRDVDVSSLAPGMYRVVMTQGTTVVSQALNIVR